MVMFLYRPPEDEVKEDRELANKAMAKIAKHRNGKLESFAFEVDNNIQKWEEIGVLDNKPWQPVTQLPSQSVFNNNITPAIQEDEDMPF